MEILFLFIGTILSILFIIMLFKGSKYDYMLESLDGDAFPLQSIYSVGFGWQDTKLFRLRGKIGDQLRSDTILIYSRQYSEYYARVVWAQVISFVHMFLAIGFVLAGVCSGDMSGFFATVGVALSAISGYYFYTYTSGKVKTMQNECDREFPNAISKLALIVNSGVILRDAWKIVAEGKEGTFYSMMYDSCVEMENGKSEVEAISEFGTKTNSDDIKKFTSSIVQSIERGGADLPVFLTNQSSELWAHKRQVMLQKGEQAAGALLMPIALMFLGVILIVISAAMQGFSM